MLTRSVFWITLAAKFLGLAVVMFRGREQVKKVEHPFASELPHALIPTPVGRWLVMGRQLHTYATRVWGSP